MTSRTLSAPWRFAFAVPLALLAATAAYAGFGSAQGGAGAPETVPVGSLSDVAVSSPTTGDFLRFDGTNWVNVSSITLASGRSVTTVGTGDLVSGDDVTAADDIIATDLVTASNLRRGSGSPEGAVTGNVGDAYQNTAGGTGTTHYYKGSGAGTNTGWVAIGGSGVSNPATGNLDMGGNAITNIDDCDITGSAHVTGYVSAVRRLTNAGTSSSATLYRGEQRRTVGGGGMETDSLPAGASGLTVEYAVGHTSGLKVLCDGTETITTSAGVTAAGGYLYSTRVGSTLRLVWLTATNTWFATPTGTWARDSTTSAGFAYTPTAWASATLVTSWDGDADVTQSTTVRQVGGTLEVSTSLTIGNVTNGAPPSAALRWAAVPSGYTVDETKMGAAAYIAGVPISVVFYDASAGGFIAGVPYYRVLNDQIGVYSMLTSTTEWSQASPVTVGDGDLLSAAWSVPVQ